jgi:hypothetical protein
MFFSHNGNINNIAIGTQAMGGSTTYNNSTHNIAMGYQSLWQINGGEKNIAIGPYAGHDMNSGYQNIAFGEEALYNNTTGWNNIAIGEHALLNNTTGNNNVAIGYWACQGDGNGQYNTGVGRYVLYQNQGNNNTGCGFAAGAGAGSPTYTNCSFFGYDADGNASMSNAMALGNGAIVTATNRVRVGNTSVTRIGGQVGWSTLSDARVKDRVAEDVVGLDFIMKLRPVTYYFDKDKADEFLGQTDKTVYDEKYDIEKIKFSGFLAQEVDEAARSVNYDFSGVNKPKNEQDTYSLKYAEFVVPMVKAIQEQQEMILELQRQNAELKEQVNELIEKQEGK